MKRIIVLGIALVTAAFGLRTTTVEPTPTPSTTTTVVVENQTGSFGAHDALQEDLSDPSAFGG